MPSFRYIAVSRENKKVAGQITAASEDQARSELHRLGFSVLSISAQGANAKEGAQGIRSFEFEGLDPSSKPVKGTIEASGVMPAYRRLVEEYNFRLSYLSDASATPEDKRKARENGMHELELQYQETKTTEKKPRKMGQRVGDFVARVLGEKKSDEQMAKERARQETHRKEFLRRVDFAIAKGNEFLADGGKKLPGERQKELQESLDYVTRVRSSNNEKNTVLAVERLLAQVKEAKQSLEIEPTEHETRFTFETVEEALDPNIRKFDETENEYALRMEQQFADASRGQMLKMFLADIGKLLTARRREDIWLKMRVEWDLYVQKGRAPRHTIIHADMNEEVAAVHMRPNFFTQSAWIWDEVRRFAGILLVFYLLYFLVVGLLLGKNFGIESEALARTLSSELLQQMLLWSFLVYCAGTFYRFYLAKADKVQMGIYWVGFAVFALFCAVNI